VNTCTAKRAVSLVFLGHAQIVHRDVENNYHTHDAISWLQYSRHASLQHAIAALRSVNHLFALPEIIVLSLYDRMPKKDVKFTRQNVYLRDRYTCQYCGKIFDPKDLNLDHVIPRDKAGKTNWENVVTSCIRCNSKKANKLPHEARMFPIHTPKAPRWRPFQATVRLHSQQESWRDFIEPSDTSVEVFV
jgi:5-methylcytosine-specific restriction endonuclease McrA